MTDKEKQNSAANADKYVRKITWTGLAVNLLLSAFKFTAGILGASQAVVADAVHSLSDSTTDVAVIAGSYYWSKPPDEDHPYGHRRIETLVTVFIGLVLFFAGIGIAWEAVESLQEPPSKPPGFIALLAAGISMVCKEILYRWTALAGKKVKSPALAANAWHHRLDAISSVPALIAVGGAIMVPHWTFLDHVGAVVVSILIMHAGLKIIWPGMKEFVDAGASKETCDEIKSIALKNKAVRQVHGIRTRYIGASLQVDMHVVVDGSITVLEGHNIAGAVKSQVLSEGSDIIDVLIHIEPYEIDVYGDECS